MDKLNFFSKGKWSTIFSIHWYLFKKHPRMHVMKLRWIQCLCHYVMHARIFLVIKSISTKFKNCTVVSDLILMKASTQNEKPQSAAALEMCGSSNPGIPTVFLHQKRGWNSAGGLRTCHHRVRPTERRGISRLKLKG